MMMMISFSTHVDFERVQKIFKSVRIIHTLRLPTHTYEPANENTYFKVINNSASFENNQRQLPSS